MLAVLSAGAGLAASDSPSDAVGLRRVGRELLWRLSALFQRGDEPSTHLGLLGSSSACGATTASSDLAGHPTPFTGDLASFRGAIELGEGKASFVKLRLSLRRHVLGDTLPRRAASSPALRLITAPMSQADVVRTVEATCSSRYRPPIRRWRPRTGLRNAPTREVAAALGTQANRHLAFERRDSARTDRLDQDWDVVVRLAPMVTKAAEDECQFRFHSSSIAVTHAQGPVI